MMPSLLDRAKSASIILLCLCGSASFLAVGWAALGLRDTLASSKTALEGVGTAAGTLNTDLGHLDAQLNGPKGLLPSATNAVQSVTVVAGQANGALTALRVAERSLNDTILDVNGRLTNKGGILDNVDSAVRDVRVNLVQASREQTRAYAQIGEQAPALTNLIKTADQIMLDLQPSLRNIEMATATTADIAKHADEMTIDFEGSLHSHLHPTRKALFFGGLWQIGKIAATHVP